MGKLAQVISTSSVQSMRYINNNFVEPEETKRKEKFRDLSVFEQMNGMKQPDDSTQSNQFMNLDIKKFKKEDDISDAVEELPALISRALEKSTTDSGIDIEKLRAELNKIKSNNYQTFPSPDQMPVRFLNYLNFLRRTQGDSAAEESLQNYFKQRAINQAKAQMVPSV